LRAPFRHTFRTEKGKTVSIWVGPDNPDFVPYGEIPPAMIKAAMSAEDGGFFRHRGFSIQQFIEALADNIRAGRVVRGASTITMQLAKNLYLPKERTLSRKFEELFITVALEQEISKRRILEIYLNIIEWGDGIYGLLPAARYYFRKHPSELTDEECAFLASIIARPRNRWRQDPLTGLGEGWRQYVDLLVRKMEEKQLPEEREPQ
jgi:membrane peptidoglycan carboxypeptidase